MNYSNNKNSLPALMAAQLPGNTMYLTIGGIPTMYYVLSPEEMNDLIGRLQANAINPAFGQNVGVPASKKEEEEYISRKRAAEILHVDESTLWRWDRDGILKPHKVGKRRTLYKTEDVMNVLENGKKHG